MSDEVVQRLAAAPFEVVGRFVDASNATLLVRLLDRDDAPLPADVTIDDLDPTDLAVHKPLRGEAPLWDFPPGTLHRREVASFLVSDALGWDLVPATVLRTDGPLGPGSLQRYVAHDPSQHYFTLRDQDADGVTAQLQAMVVLDLVINNADRKGGHVLVEVAEAAGTPGAPRLQLIDHGVTFHVEDKLRTVAWDFAHQRVPDRLRADVRELGTWLARDGCDRLGELLAPAEVDALAGRVADVGDLATFPAPTGPRPFPWPVL